MMKIWIWAIASMTVIAGCTTRPYDLETLRQEHALSDREEMFKDVPVESESFTYEQLVTMALKRNLELLATKQEELIQREITLGALSRQLPELYARGDFSHRNNPNASSSQDLYTGLQSLAPSISTEQWSHHIEYGLAWNLLDFGISYYNYRQEYKKTIIAQQQYIRLQQNLLLEMTRSYWRAIVAKKASLNATEIIKLAQKRQKDLEEQISQRLVSEFEGLENERALVEMQMRLQNFDREYRSARTELASQVGLPPHYPLKLVMPKLTSPLLKQIPMDIHVLEHNALTHRPELVVQDMEEKIRADEARSAIISMFPSMRVYARGDWDDNPFLINHNWATIGTLISYDLLRYPSLMRGYKAAKMKKELAYKSRLAVSIGVLTQVNLAYLQYRDALSQYLLARDLSIVNHRLLKAAEKARSNGELGDADLLNYQAQALFAEVNATSTYGDVQIALEHLANALGMPLYFLGWEQAQVPETTQWQQRISALPNAFTALPVTRYQGVLDAPIKNPSEKIAQRYVLTNSNLDIVKGTSPAIRDAAADTAVQETQKSKKGLSWVQRRQVEQLQQGAALPARVHSQGSVADLKQATPPSAPIEETH